MNQQAIRFCFSISLLFFFTLAMADENLFFVEKQVALESAKFAKLAKAKTSKEHKQAQLQTEAVLAQLQRIDRLIAANRLYEDVSELQGTSPTIVRGYLAKQRSRIQVLASYAIPYVDFLRNQPTLTFKQEPRLSYWINTLAQLAEYTQSTSSSNQLLSLEQTFFDLAALALDDAAIFTRSKAPSVLPPYEHDYFSLKRKTLEDITFLAAQSLAQEQLNNAFIGFSGRFNRNVAGRYPFGPVDRPDASPAAVKDLLHAYGSESATLMTLLERARKYEKTNAMRGFMRQLDPVAAFFQDSLCCAESSQPFHVAVNFQVLPQFTRGHDQVVSMRMTSGFQHADFPNGKTTLAWRPGDPVSFEIDFAHFSDWRPVADPSNPALVVEGTRVTYAAEGDWALLRLIDSMRPQKGPSTDPLNPYMAYLEMAVPLVSTTGSETKATSHARIYLGITLSSVTPDTQVLKPRKLPSFPPLAPSRNGN